MNSMEIFVIVVSGFCMLAAIVLMYIVMENNRILKNSVQNFRIHGTLSM